MPVLPELPFVGRVPSEDTDDHPYRCLRAGGVGVDSGVALPERGCTVKLFALFMIVGCWFLYTQEISYEQAHTIYWRIR